MMMFLLSCAISKIRHTVLFGRGFSVGGGGDKVRDGNHGMRVVSLVFYFLFWAIAMFKSCFSLLYSTLFFAI
jgi:hypothetical protein